MIFRFTITKYIKIKSYLDLLYFDTCINIRVSDTINILKWRETVFIKNVLNESWYEVWSEEGQLIFEETDFLKSHRGHRI